MSRLLKLTLVTFLLLVGGWTQMQSVPPRAAFITHRVAHAGGGVQGQTYTNSYEALNANRQNDFRYFEIDFSFTSDGRPVCLHDWEGAFQNLFGYKISGPLSYAEFSKEAKKLKYEPCTLDGLAAWMQVNSGTKIVTDFKERNIEGLKLIFNSLPDASSRVIPQIYFPDEYWQVKEMGFEQVIWTLYRYSGSTKQVLSWVKSFDGPLAVTMPKQTARTKLPAMLAQHGIPTYVHTINDSREAQEFEQSFHVTEIYTDFLRP